MAGLVAILLNLALLAFAAAGVSCPTGVTGPDDSYVEWREIGGKCFWLSRAAHTFESCNKHVCGPLGGTLACHPENEVIDLHEFNNYDSVLNYTGRMGGSRAAWLGYSRAGPDRTWQWINGCGSRWQNWKKGSPEMQCGAEYCAILGPKGVLSDLSCRMEQRCLCEWQATLAGSYEASLATMREDTCYSGCGKAHGNGWCRAWPFWEHSNWEQKTCQWQAEAKQGDLTAMGPQLRECVSRARKTNQCGKYVSFALGHCACIQAHANDANCLERAVDETFDIFLLTDAGVEHVEHGERCEFSITIDERYFRRLKNEWGATPLKAIWFLFGLPCLVFTGAVVLHVWNPGELLREKTVPRFVTGNFLQNMLGDYGEVLRADNPASSSVVNRWMLLGGGSTIVYGFALLVNGVIFRMADQAAPMALTSAIMCVSSCLGGASAIIVHEHLSPAARSVAGFWLYAFAISKFLLGICALSQAGQFIAKVRHNLTSTALCWTLYEWQWASVVALPLQCLSGAALWQIRDRAGVEGGVASVFLVAGSFIAGVGIWGAAFLSNLFEKSHGFGLMMRPCYYVAAVGHLAAGIALLIVNKEVKQAGVVEVSDDVELVTAIGARSGAELTNRKGRATPRSGAGSCQKRDRGFGL